MKDKSLTHILAILESPNGRYFGFRLTRCADGAQCEASTTGTDNNLKSAFCSDARGWHSHTYTHVVRTSERDIFKLQHAGCSPDDLRAWAANNLK